MASSELVKEFLSHLEPEELPPQFIAAASIRDMDGQEVLLKGEKLQMLMSNHPDYAHVKDARIFINIQKVIKAINLEVEYIFETVDRLLIEDSED